MPNDDFLADFTKLGGDYQILTELHGEGSARTYLARHLRLNRDVTISVFRAAGGVTADTLARFAADVRLLSEARHEHIVPDIDGIWLDDGTFAAVRARVRGATLDQSLSASGPMSIARVAATMHDVASALSWARETGVTQRDVAPWDIVFQQGSGRVLLSFEPGKTVGDAARTECDDARTLRRLTIEMLAGEIDRDVSAEEIAVPRAIPSDIADALAAMRHCTPRNATTAIAALLAALDAAAASGARNDKSRIVPTVAPPVLSGAVIDPVAEREVPPVVQPSADSMLRPMPVVTSVPRHRKGDHARRDDAVIMTKPSFGFNARLATAIVALAVLAGAGFVVVNRRTPPNAVASGIPADTAGNAAGEVVLHPVPPPRPAVSPSRSTGAMTDSAPAKPRAAAPPKRHVVADSAAEAERQFKRDSAADVVDPCLSSEASKQQQCLSDAIERNDRELNRAYARLIAAYRRQTGAAAADPDPEAVNTLRAEQRTWVDARNAECRQVGEGPLFAKSRAACYAQRATDRARELQQRVAGIPPAG